MSGIPWRTELEAAVEDALACRGTVMLRVVSAAKRQWVAAVAAVDGSLEVRCGEPHRPWWTRRKPLGEHRLEAMGFVPVVHAWARWVEEDVRGPARRAAEYMSSALLHGLEVQPEARLERVLVQPGFVPWQPPPPADAPPAAHVEAALVTLVRAGRGNARFDFGRPSRPRAWADVVGDSLALEIEGGDEWTVPLELGPLREVAGRLAGNEDGPLFISLVDVPDRPS